VAHLPKLLVLTSSPPGCFHGGGVVLDEILRRYPRDRYVSFSVNALPRGADRRQAPESLRGIPSRTGPLVPRLGLRGARFYMPVLWAIGFRGVASLRIRQAFAFGQRHGVELVWAELQGDALVIAQRVADRLGVPFVGTVWDDPEGWFADYGYDRFSRRFLWGKFRGALRTARNLSTAGEAMQRAYESEYGVRSVILRHGFDTLATPPERRRDDEGIEIGFVGSAYGRETWNAFLSAVQYLNGLSRLPHIRLRVFGGGDFPYKCDGVQIEVRGWQPADRMLRELAETDFCYLPCWFEPAKRRHAELSFPNKFETYLAAGRPVLFHGPVYAGVAAIIRQYGVGLCLHSLDEKEIVPALERLSTDSAMMDSFARAARVAFHTEFNAHVMVRNFSYMIGVPPNQLVAGHDST
jgi:hypothetical protein